MSFLDFYNRKNIGFTGKILMILAVVNLFLSATTTPFYSISDILSFFALQIFYNSCAIPIIYKPHEKNIKELGTDYIQYIVLPTYILIFFGYSMGYKSFSTSMNLLSSYISFPIHSVYLTFLILNLYFPTMYFFYVYLKYKETHPILIFFIISLVGSLSAIGIGKFIFQLF